MVQVGQGGDVADSLILDNFAKSPESAAVDVPPRRRASKCGDGAG
jgi:hypothetical protein